MELRTTRTVLGAKVTTYDRSNKVSHKKKEAYKGSLIAKNQLTAEKQYLLNSLQAKQWKNASFDLKAKIEEKKLKKRLEMKKAGKLWKLKNKQK